MYELGTVLKSLQRTDAVPLFVMVCNTGKLNRSLDQTKDQFRAVVLFSGDEEYRAGEVFNDWNKGKDNWAVASFSDLPNQVEGKTLTNGGGTK